ncbi:hypothetical protein [Streptomyces bikiniensis]|uniref:hypothetical protein n=1 Tax=Streptomyces bikiniensis TaxID=1896 RepID=UPI0007C77B81|nr:hypothetical protein [Streptomyces bikiniensis]
MIYRNFSAPSRGFTQFSHELIRHPRLSSHAVRLLTWQLSLPENARENLSRTAERAGIGGDAFTKAKRQLIAEGFVHERRVQVVGGRWVTQQLVSNVPLSCEQAVKIFARDPRLLHRAPVNPQVAPGPRNPAAGSPVSPSTGGHPEKYFWENNSNLPAFPEEPEATAAAEGEEEVEKVEEETPAEPEAAEVPEEPEAAEAPEAAETPKAAEVVTPAAPDESPSLEEARTLVGVLPILSPTLRRIPPGMRDELTRLAARWLDAGYTSADIHAHVLRGLPGDGTRVHRPGGLVRYLLREVPPRTLPRPTPPPSAPPSSAPQPSAPSPSASQPSGARSSGSRLSPRLQGARECSGFHTQSMLFRPVADETHCRECTAEEWHGTLHGYPPPHTVREAPGRAGTE